MGQLWGNSSSAASDGIAVTPSNSTLLSPATRGLYIGVAGDVTVRMDGAKNTVTFTACPVGVLPVSVDMVMLTGTAATNIVRLW